MSEREPVVQKAVNSAAGVTLARLSSIATPLLLALVGFLLSDLKTNLEDAIAELRADVRGVVVDVTRIDAEQNAQDRRLDSHDGQLERIGDRLLGGP